ncbi:MAG: MBL fold metallo-hydrolase [Xanthomonadaceae bacterium]|nr:MBL fold metallo-hydrolase [Xanthomonadaceae bacterium]
MNVKVLVEDTGLSPAHRCEHGLSLYIETQNHKVLFDMGQGNLFLENAERMGVDIEAVDIAILSHGHYDHGGGIEAFLKRNARANLYADADAFQPHCAKREDGRIDDIGLDLTIARNPRIQAPRRALRIDDELCIFSGVIPHRLFPPANRALLMKTPHCEPDDFSHEQNLIVTQGGEDVLFTGCAHNGIVNIIEAAGTLQGRTPRWVVGGFHLCLKESAADGDTAFAVRVADALSAYDAVYYTGHCTGEGGYRLIQERLGDRVFRLSTGLEFKI